MKQRRSFSFRQRGVLFIVFFSAFLTSANFGVLFFSKPLDHRPYVLSSTKLQGSIPSLKQRPVTPQPTRSVTPPSASIPTIHETSVPLHCVDSLPEGELSSGWRDYQTFPFWKQSKGGGVGSDVILVTHLSMNRLSRLEQLLRAWNGFSSVSVSLCLPSEVDAVAQWYVTLPSDVRAKLSIHLSIGTGQFYPINHMRNLALNNARDDATVAAEFAAVIDVDAMVVNNAAAQFTADVQHVLQNTRTTGGKFTPTGDNIRTDGEKFARGNMKDGGKFTSSGEETKASGETMSISDGELIASEEKLVMVIGAFEFSSEGMSLVNSKSELRRLFEEGSVQAMHKGRPSYSGPFKHFKWIYMEENAVKRIDYQLMFEPYFIIKLDQCNVDFNEDFIGRGFNKQAFHFELWASGFDYVVLPNVFIIDTPHEQSWSIDDSAFTTNRLLWLTHRDQVINQYQLHCKDSSLRLCDEKKKHCDKACRRQPEPHRDNKTKKKRKKKFRHEELDHSYEGRERKWWNDHTKLLYKRRKKGYRNADGGQLKSTTPNCSDGVDVVYTWVNGSDPWHMSIQREHIPPRAFKEQVDLGDKRKGKAGDLGFRFRDFERASTLRYSLRSFLLYAPWVRKVHIVTGGRYGNASDLQIPSWLNVEETHGRVQIVAHETIFDKPKEQLPTLNSCAIETRLHYIPGLAECYLYVNDDIMLLQPVSLEDFWGKDEQLPYAMFTAARSPRIGKSPWEKKIAKVGRMLNREVHIPWEQIFLAGHFFTKTVVQETERALQSDFDRTSRERWRTDESLWVPFVYANYFAWTYAVQPKQVSSFYHRLTDPEGAKGVNKMFSSLSNEKPTWLCVNDLLTNLTDLIKEALVHGFDKLYPDVAPYEKDLT